MTYLFAAYTIVWLGVLWYALNLGQRHKRLSDQVEALEAALKSQQGPGAPATGSGTRRA